MEPFKNNFSHALVDCFADHLAAHVVAFDRALFADPVHAGLDALELKDRAQLIADHIHLALPTDAQSRAEITRAMLHPSRSNIESDQLGISGWGAFALTMVVGQHGIADFDRSMELLKEMTPLFSSEFGVRYFLLADQDRALKIFSRWVDDPDQHVRRLASEGSRPRLPWAMQLPSFVADPASMLPLLKRLRDDPEEYVRRSVANHLNDIAKDHPDLVAEIAHAWMVGASPNRKRLLRHACRSLIKQGHAGALAAFGFSPPEIMLKDIEVGTGEVEMGGAVEFSAELVSTAAQTQKLIVDYVVHFQKANGKLAGKVFKWKSINLAPGASLLLERRHAIRPITTRKYHPGLHKLSLRINGQDFGSAEFNLSM